MKKLVPIIIVLLSTLYLSASGNSPFSELTIRNGIPATIAKCRAGDTLTVAYLGGSITEQDGWRIFSQEIIRKQFPLVTIREVNSTVGGTGSDFGLFRLQETVLKHQPDLLFVEFAVNDDGVEGTKIRRNLESIVRLAKSHASQPELVVVYTFKEDFLVHLNKKQLPPSVVAMESIATHYGIPSISYIPEVFKRLSTKKMAVKGAQPVLNGMEVFSPDGVHPFVETGHRLYADVFARSFANLIQHTTDRTSQLPEPLSAGLASTPTLIPFTYLHLPGKWTQVEPFNTKLQRQISTFGGKLFKTEDNNNSLTVYFKGTAIGFVDVVGPGSGRLLVEIDDCIRDTLLRVDAWSHSWRLQYKIYDGLENKEHRVRFTVLDGTIDKTSVLDVSKVKDKSELANQSWYPVALLLDGQLVMKFPDPATGAKFVGNIANDRPDESYKELWNQITPENTTKWQRCEPNDNRWTFERSKGIYDYCRENNMPFKFHTLIWGAQYPNFIDSLRTDADLRTAVEDWIRKAGETFPDADYVDVVNEPLFGHEAPFFRRAIGGMNGLYGTGWDWVIWSFERAREAFPNSKLLINDFNILKSKNNIKRYSHLIKLLHDRGLLDGIGCQTHWIEGRSAENIASGIDYLTTLCPGIPVYVSELEINIANDFEQKEKLKELFTLFWHHPAIKGITFWGYQHSWLGKNAVLVRDGVDRPAMIWLKSFSHASSLHP